MSDDYNPYNANMIRDPGNNQMRGSITTEEYRKANPQTVWLFNPWTGLPRTSEEIDADPLGSRVRHFRLTGL
jgi:hypothetical protein